MAFPASLPGRPTPPSAPPGGIGGVGMSAPVPPGFMGGPEGGPAPAPGADILAILGELQIAGVEVRAGPNGTILLTGVPAEILGQLEQGATPNPAG